MRTDALHYDLPEPLIARYPTTERDGARLLVLHRDGRQDRRVAELDQLLPSRALVVVNDTRVLAARLLGRKEGSGGRVEVLLVEPEAEGGDRWRALTRSSKPLRSGQRIEVGDDLVVEIVRPSRDGAAADGTSRVALHTRSGAPVVDRVAAEGHLPLPPYLRREAEASDRERYQTVFAREPGAIAAPTAGLHFSAALIQRLRARGIDIEAVTLHVGLGTFRPVVAADLDDHPMHAERYVVPPGTAEAIRRARAEGRPVVAVGTTVVRALESVALESGQVVAGRGETRLLIQPGFRFRVVDGLVTNFHLPGSTLLALVYAFAGAERVAEAYRHAVREQYRFFSYGDAMLLWP